MSEAHIPNEDVSHAWDEFVAYVTNNPSSRFLTISAEMAKRLMKEHEEDLDRMERAATVVEAANTERAGVTKHMAWLIERVAWLKREMDNGGNWQYLNNKREETAYCLEKLRAHLPALKESQ
jgi:hypothetical protein